MARRIRRRLLSVVLSPPMNDIVLTPTITWTETKGDRHVAHAAGFVPAYLAAYLRAKVGYPVLLRGTQGNITVQLTSVEVAAVCASWETQHGALTSDRA